MTTETEIKRALHRVLDPIELPATIPAEITRAAKKRKAARIGSAVLALVVLVTFASVVATGLLRLQILQPAQREHVPFVPLPVESGPEGLLDSPLAPAGFPDCTTDLVDVRPDVSNTAVSVTLRPKPGVQCGLQWWANPWWVDATGQRYELSQKTPVGRQPPKERLLLMGSAGATHSAGVRPVACDRLQPPLTYFIELAGERVEVGTVEHPLCGVHSYRPGPYIYRMPGLETPAAWLDPTLEVPELVSGDELRFELRLRNDTDQRVVLGMCPLFDATFAAADGKSHLRSYLNCPDAPDSVEPGNQLRFRIELPLRDLSGSGRLRLVLRDHRRMLHRITSDEVRVQR